MTLVEAMILLHVVDNELLPAAMINGLRGIGQVRDIVDSATSRCLPMAGRTLASVDRPADTDRAASLDHAIPRCGRGGILAVVSSRPEQPDGRWS